MVPRTLRQEWEELRTALLCANQAVVEQDARRVVESVERLLARVEFENRRISRRQQEMEARLLALEASRFFRLLRLPGRVWIGWKDRIGRVLPFIPQADSGAEAYALWLQRERPPEPKPLDRYPAINIVMCLQSPRREWLQAAVDSVLSQSYECWQLCICDNGSGDGWVAEYLAERAAATPRVRYIRSAEVLDRAAALNRAAGLADGEYVGFLGQHDTLSPHALYCVAEAVQDAPNWLYSDEDRLDAAGRRTDPVFKPAFSPDLLRCCMYAGQLLIVRRQCLDHVGWFRSGPEGTEAYDLALRLAEHGGAVRHLPRVLYHARQESGVSVDAPIPNALAEAVTRRDARTRIEPGPAPGSFRIRWPAPGDAKASVIICSRNPRLLRRCLRSIARRTSYGNREVIVVQHLAGPQPAMDRLLKSVDCLRVPYAGPFNFAAMNNLAASKASGDILVFLNDDVEPLSAEWLEALIAHAARREVGAVGARLLYRSGAIQHAGMAIGIMEGAGHPHRDTFAAPFWKWLPFTRNVSAVTGACLAMRKSVFAELGGFDESFPENYNDVDLCLRAREAGYEVILEPAAVLRHDECRTRRPGVFLAERERFEDRWAEWLERGDLFYSPHFTRRREDAALELDEIVDLRPRP